MNLSSTDKQKPLAVPASFGLAEVHAHTLASDGMVTPEQLVEAAAKIGLQVLCITDHDTMNGVERAEEVGALLGVEIVRGQEITTALPSGTHVIGLFIERPIRMSMSLEDTVDAIHDQGGLAILPHPLMPTFFASITPRRARKLLESRTVDGFELRHTAPMGPGGWRRLDNFYTQWRDRLGAAVGASDSHFGINDLGRVATLFEGTTAADLRRSIEKRTTSPFQGFKPEGPSWRTRLAQQKRSMLWLSGERLRGKVGAGVGPMKEQ